VERRRPGLARPILAVTLLAAAACGSSLVRIPGRRVEVVETFHGGSPRDAPSAEAHYDAGRDLPFLTVSPIGTLMGPVHYAHRVDVPVRAEGGSWTFSVPRALYSLRGERLSTVTVPGGVSVAFRGEPAAGPPPREPTVRGGNNPAEFVTVDGRVARYTTHAAFLPSRVGVGAADVDRVEIDVDLSPVVCTSSPARAKRVAAGQHLELPLDHAVRSGLPALRSPAPDGLRAVAVAAPEDAVAGLLGWKLRTPSVALDATERAALLAAAAPGFRVVADGAAVAIDVPADAPPGRTSLLVWADTTDPVVGAAYVQLEVVAR
jgi:hypothetical protein